LRVKSYLVGSFPRPEALIKAFREAAKGRVSESELRETLMAHVKTVVGIQERCRLTYLTDGQLNWHDLLRPLADMLEGVEVNGLSRWFDNNAFYRLPVVKSRLRLRGSIFPAHLMGEHVPQGRLKAILPEPYTMARLSDNTYYRRFDDLALGLAEAIGEEAAAAERLGAVQVQLSAPTLVTKKMSRDEVELVSQCLAEVRKQTTAQLLLHTFYGSAAYILPHALDFPIDILGLDMTVTKTSDITDYSISKILCLGVVDGRNSLIEDSQKVATKVWSIAEKLASEEIHVAPSCELEWLPFDVASRKVEVLGEAAARLGEME